jgi:uncharacterized protein (DUF58 family)
MSQPKTEQSGWLNWMEDRFPESKQVTLNLRRIFVIPTKVSLSLLITLGVLFLMAINFQSSLIYALTFWLLAFIVISIFFTYRNLAGLTIRAVQSKACFAGEKAVFEIEVSCAGNQKKSAISLGWKNQDIARVNLQNHQRVIIKLSHSTKARGLFKPDKISIFTVYPVGLVVAWSYAMLDMESIVYPKPILQDSTDNQQGKSDDSETGKEIARGSTDFSGIREYQAGDSPKHIHWGAYAKTGQAYTKTFVDYANQDIWLDWDTLDIAGVESKLSHLSAKLLQYHQEQQVYGLKIPGKTIQPSTGEAHKTICLTALALYGRSNNV